MHLLIYNMDDVGDGSVVATAVFTTAAQIAGRLLGSQVVAQAGSATVSAYRRFRFLVNASGAIIPKGTPVMTKAGETSAYKVTPCTANIAQVRMQGIPQCDVPIGAGFYALVEGPSAASCGVLSNGTVTVDVPQTTAAAGRGTDAVVGTNESWGFATATNNVAGTLGACFVKLP